MFVPIKGVVILINWKEVPVISQETLGGKGVFYVGGRIKDENNKHYLTGQMFVEVYVPNEIIQPYPIVFFHGAGQTNVNWLITPDGRMGWSDYFVRQGYVVFLAEQPARGRSAYHPQTDGSLMYRSMEEMQERFTSDQGKWTQAKLHTQWPDDGHRMSEPIFKSFAQSQVEYLSSNRRSQEMVLACAGELLAKTGPTILVTHSQAGPFGWTILDMFPELVKAIVALEPSGPPFSEDLSRPLAKNYGVAEIPLHYVPSVKSPADFKLELLRAPHEKLSDGWVMEEPAYQLPNLQNTPIAIITGEASYHAGYDHLISHFFTQAGVEHDFIRLEEVSIHGNGHMMMLEKNNLEIAEFIHKWICKSIKKVKEEK